MMSEYGAYYDSEKDKIYGCKKGTMVWYHERGHQILHNDYKWKTLMVYHIYILLFSIAKLIADDRYWAAVAFNVFMIIQVFDEFYAWYFALRNYKNWRK
jgi:hypothetical protein